MIVQDSPTPFEGFYSQFKIVMCCSHPISTLAAVPSGAAFEQSPQTGTKISSTSFSLMFSFRQAKDSGLISIQVIFFGLEVQPWELKKYLSLRTYQQRLPFFQANSFAFSLQGCLWSTLP